MLFRVTRSPTGIGRNKIDPDRSRRSSDRSIDHPVYWSWLLGAWRASCRRVSGKRSDNTRFENTRATLSLSLSLSSFRSARRRPLALENGQYPCKLNCADVSVKLKRMENRFSRARAPVPFSCLREFHPREDPSLDPIERSGGEQRDLAFGFSFREFARNEGRRRGFSYRYCLKGRKYWMKLGTFFSSVWFN